MKLINPYFSAENIWRFDAPPGDVWRVLSSTDRYEDWWPWMKMSSVLQLQTGAAADADVRSPLGYHVRFVLSVTDAVAPTRLALGLDGQIKGTSLITLTPYGTGTEMHMLFNVEARSTLLRAMSGVFHRPLAWAHDEVMRNAIKRLRQILASPDERP